MTAPTRLETFLVATALAWPCVVARAEEAPEAAAAEEAPSEPETEKDAPPEPKTDAEPKKKAKKKKAKKKKAGRIQAGPYVAAGVPYVAAFGANVLIAPRVSAHVGASHFEKTFDTKRFDGDVTMQHVMLGGRWHPFGGFLFAGLDVGQQILVANGIGETKTSYKGESLTLKIKARIAMRSVYATPMIGYFGTVVGGLTLGGSVGYQVPLVGRYAVDAETDDEVINEAVDASPTLQAFLADVRGAARRASTLPLPHVTLLSVGWLF